MENSLIDREGDKTIVKQVSKRMDLSILRIIATVAIVLLHTCSALSDNSILYSLSSTELYSLSSISLLMRWAVPVFLMISGALLIREDKNTTYKEVQKYCKRIFLALFFFGISFSMLEIFMDEKIFSFQIFLKACFNVIIGNSWAHLWYLYLIFGIYLILPLINIFVSRARVRTIFIYLMVLFLFSFIFPLINNILDIKIFFSIPVGSYAVFYFIVGNFLYHKWKVTIKRRYLLSTIILLGSLILLVNARGGKTYLGYDSPIIAGMAICMFMLSKDIQIKNIGVIWKFDRLCFGVYLIHPLFINIFYKAFKITPLCFSEGYLLGVFLFWLGFTIISYLSSYVMKKVKFLNSIIS